jgi:hypothetical protein
MRSTHADNARNVRRMITLMYCGGVLFAEVMFISYLGHAFDTTIVQIFAAVGAILVGFSSIVFLKAKEHWFADGWHERIGYTFWALDLLMLALNTLVAFTVAKVIRPSDLPILADVIKYWGVLSPATPLIVIGMWSVLWAMSPDHLLSRATNKQWAMLVRKQADLMLEHAMNSPEALAIIRQSALNITKDNARSIAAEHMGVLPSQVPSGLGLPGSSTAAGATVGLPSRPPMHTMNADGNGDNGHYPKA